MRDAPRELPHSVDSVESLSPHAFPNIMQGFGRPWLSRENPLRTRPRVRSPIQCDDLGARVLAREPVENPRSQIFALYGGTRAGTGSHWIWRAWSRRHYIGSAIWTSGPLTCLGDDGSSSADHWDVLAWTQSCANKDAIQHCSCCDSCFTMRCMSAPGDSGC